MHGHGDEILYQLATPVTTQRLKSPVHIFYAGRSVELARRQDYKLKKNQQSLYQCCQLVDGQKWDPPPPPSVYLWFCSLAVNLTV